jgi:hypothetical protein
MPKKLEEALKRQAKKKGFGKKRTGAYVYGTLRKMGWKPNHNADGPSGEIDYSPSIVIDHKD